MRKLYLWVVILPFLLNNCDQSNAKKSEKQDNVLLAKAVTVSSPIIIDNQNNPEWTKPLDKNIFFKVVFDKVMAKKVIAYNPNPFEYLENKTPYPLESINGKMNWENKTQDYGELKEVMFFEKWFFSREKLELSKEVISWCPIRVWTENGKDLKRLMFSIYPKNVAKGKKIAESIIYEIPWYFEYPTTNIGLDQNAFFKFIIDGIKSNEINAYDPIYLIDKTKRKFSQDQLVKYIGKDLIPGLINSQLSSLLFEEDWYFDENTLTIKKEVKSIAFVEDNYNSDNTSVTKKILFFIFPKE